jgi:hypothetical protein
MACAYFLQSTEKPDFKLKPQSHMGYMILVESKICAYGATCNRKCWSICPYNEGGIVYTINKHKKIHYHIKQNAKWTNGKRILEFKKI